MTERNETEARSSVVWTMIKVLGAATVCGIAVMMAIVAFWSPRTEAQNYVESDNADLPRIEYADGLLSVNDRCIVAQRKLNKIIKPVYVNGQPVGFC